MTCKGMRMTVGAVCLALGSIGAEASAESLADAFIAAYSSSSLLESSRALMRMEDESISQAVLAFLPTWSASAGIDGSIQSVANSQMTSHDPSESLNGVLQLTMQLLLYDGGDRQLIVDASQESALALRQSLIETEQAVLLNAAQAYHDVLRQTEQLALARSGLTLNETELEAARNRFELGENTRSDVSLVEASLAAAQSRVFLREGELEIARQSYKLATGNEPGRLLPTPPLPGIPNSLDEAVAIAATIHPAIKRAQHTVSAAKYNLKRTETVNDPRVYLNSSARTSRDLSELRYSTDSFSVGVNATIPLGQDRKLGSVFRQAVASVDRARTDLRREAEIVRQKVAIAWARLEIARSTLPAREKQVAAARLAYTGIREEASLGTRTTLDVLNSEQNLLEAQTNQITALFDRDMAVYSLLEAIGLLTVQHLQLGVPVYDVEANFQMALQAPSVRNRQEILDAILADRDAEN